MFIHHAASITAQGFCNALQMEESLEKKDSYLANEPDYKELLPPMVVRRMAKITRMALMCALSIDKTAGSPNWSGIIMATGLGNLVDTDKFLTSIVMSKEGLISPTSFTQSSHNTVSGNIALILKNYNYNMTHVQQSFSFENALIDAQLQMHDKKENLLVGACDEYLPLLSDIAVQLNFDSAKAATFGEGSSFFAISALKAPVSIHCVLVKHAVADLELEIESVLKENIIDRKTCLILSISALGEIYGGSQLDATEYCGRYFTNSAFALHLAISQLRKKEKHTTALIVNTDLQNNLGLILVGIE